MATPKRDDVPSTWRLRLGESVLAAARAIDTSPVKARLEEFEQAHRDYARAHHTIELAEARLQTAETELAACDATQDKTITALAGVLISEGQPLVNPFAAFDAPPVRTFTALRPAQKTEAVHQLVAVMQRNAGLGETTKKAAKAADEAARALQQALVPVKTMRKTVRDARRAREARTHAWDKALACLKSDARTVAKGGAPEIYAAFFPPRSATKSSKATASPPPATETPAAPTPPDTKTSDAA